MAPKSIAGIGLGCLFTLILSMAGCSARRGPVAESECKPVEGQLAATARTEGLAGEYRLTLVASKGERAGSAVEGRLWLEPHDSAMRYVTSPGGERVPNVLIPLYGRTDIDLDEIDALRLGDLTSLDPMRPGVVVTERHGDPQGPAFAEIVLRLGSEANRRDLQRFDGGYTALHVRWMAPGSFGGTWASGVRGPQSEGYFCAYRVEE